MNDPLLAICEWCGPYGFEPRESVGTTCTCNCHDPEGDEEE